MNAPRWFYFILALCIVTLTAVTTIRLTENKPFCSVVTLKQEGDYSYVLCIDYNTGKRSVVRVHDN